MQPTLQPPRGKPARSVQSRTREGCTTSLVSQIHGPGSMPRIGSHGITNATNKSRTLDHRVQTPQANSHYHNAQANFITFIVDTATKSPTRLSYHKRNRHISLQKFNFGGPLPTAIV